jgi:hypothetical protein
MPDDGTPSCRVISATQSLIQIEVLDPEAFKGEPARNLCMGSYLEIGDDDGLRILALVYGYRLKDPTERDGGGAAAVSFVLDAQPIGFLDASGQFVRGGQQIAIPPTRVRIAEPATLAAIYASAEESSRLCFGKLAQDANIDVPINGDVFFGRHVAVVGSTGSGKSCTVAGILQTATKRSANQATRGVLANAHVVLFDLHGEYGRAFPQDKRLDINSLKLPYWLMNAEELEELFVLGGDRSHNQTAQFRHAVSENKRRHNPGANKVSYDTPVYFSIEEVFNYLHNLNVEVIGKKENEGVPKLKQNDTLVTRREDHYFAGKLTFVESSTAAATKASNGPFHGEFDRFLFRLRSMLDLDRLAFLLQAKKPDGTPFVTADAQGLVSDVIGYGVASQNVTLIDLSGVPFEVQGLVVSLISRMIFDVGFHLKRTTPDPRDIDGDIAFLAVYEEAHKYVPNSGEARFGAASRSIERIAKEGRKYGVGMMIVSQRPSDVSETVFSQCNSCVVMRLTNPADQDYVKRLLPDFVKAVAESLSTLEQREALIVGAAIQVPSLVRVDGVEHTPDSADIAFQKEWRKDWIALPFARVMDGMRRY